MSRSTPRIHPFPGKFTRRTPDDLLQADGGWRLSIFACGASDRHRVALSLQAAFWQGDVPTDNYDPDAALEALLRDGYYAWTLGGAP